MTQRFLWASSRLLRISSLPILLSFMILACLCCGPIQDNNKDPSPAPTPAPNPDPAHLSASKSLAWKAVNAFAVELYSKLDRGKNLCVSPYSMFAPLAVAAEGAQGTTKSQMMAVLRTDQADVELLPTLGGLKRSIVSSVQGGGGIWESARQALGGGQDEILSIADGIWVHRGEYYHIRPDFAERSGKDCDVAIRESNFKDSPERVANEINAWVKKSTSGRIAKVISPKDILKDRDRPNEKTEPGFVIVNAVYFKSSWEKKFEKGQTRAEDFTLLDGSKTKCQMMHKTSRHFRYMEEPDFQALEMPYKGGQLSMVVFLPRKTDGLPNLEETLTYEKLDQWMGLLKSVPGGVDVSFPKFKAEYEFEMTPALKSMGMEDAFSPFKADFWRMMQRSKEPGAGLYNIYLKDALQTVWIEVSEEGTEAAAATRVRGFGYYTGAPRRDQPVVFRADHPFLYLIRHIPTGCILFMGRVTKP